jgi:hypothetical protein
MELNEEYIHEQEEKIDALLGEFELHRNEIKKMISELEDIRNKIDTLIPTSIDKRYVRFFEEKVKSLTSFFNSLLEMRKEIAKSVKDEIEIRRRISRSEDKLIDVEDMLDVRSFANKIEEFKGETINLKKKRKEKFGKQKIDPEIDIPGLTGENEGV